MKNKFAIGLAIASISGFASSYALANPTQIKLYNGAGDSNGGEFIADVIAPAGPYTPFQAPSVLYGVGTDFITFCLEKSETFSYGQTLYVVGAPSTSAVKGGNGYAATYGADVGGSASADPISKATAYLFTEFSKGTLSGYDYAYTTIAEKAARAADADNLQKAIWYLENESTTALTGQALTWYNLAITNSASWSDIGNVRALNLYKMENGQLVHSQDQLYMTAPVPEPETYAMMLAGLGLIGFLAKRRRRNLL